MSRKLLFIMHDRPNYPGGPIVNYRRLLPELVKKGHEVHLIPFYQDDYPNARYIEGLGAKIYPLKHTHTEEAVKNILDVVEKVQPDAFIPDVSTPGCFAGKWVKMAGIPVITTHRSDDQNNWGRAVYFSHPKYHHQLSGIVCVSKSLNNELLKKISPAIIPTAVIPSGVMIPDKICNQSESALKIVYAGRLVQEQKRVREIINAFLGICSRFKNIQITIVGNGNEMAHCKMEVEKSSYASRFNFTGTLQGEKYKLMLLQQQIIVLFSDFEGTPGSLLDGMSCGLIPVCYNYPGASELIRNNENGLLINDREQAFFDAIQKLHNSIELRKRLSLAARKTIVDGYSLNDSVNRWERFIGDCIEREGAKMRFTIPHKIVLPSHDPILVEDIRHNRQSLFKRHIAKVFYTLQDLWLSFWFCRRYGVEKKLMKGEFQDKSGLYNKRDNYKIKSSLFSINWLIKPHRINHIIISKSLRFSNSLIQLCHVLLIANRLGVKRIYVPDSFWYLINDFYIDGIEFMKYNNSKPKSNGVYLEGVFFYLKTLLPIVGKQLPSKNDLISHFKQYLRIKKSFKAYDLVIHIRSGDVFAQGGTNLYYGQPPLSYYLKILKSFHFNDIAIVFENKANPIIPEVIKRASSLCKAVDIYSGTLEEDLGVLLNAKNIVAGCGTFVEGVIALSDRIKNLFIFNGRFVDWGGEINIISVNDITLEYHNNVTKCNWTNTPGQIDLMMNYSESKLGVKGTLLN